MKDVICYSVRALIADNLDISKNWMIDFSMLGRGNPKDLLTESELIVHIIREPSDDKT